MKIQVKNIDKEYALVGYWERGYIEYAEVERCIDEEGFYKGLLHGRKYYWEVKTEQGVITTLETRKSEAIKKAKKYMKELNKKHIEEGWI